MAQWRESLDQMLAMVESIKRNIERNSWDGRIRNLLNYIEQLDCEATIETKALEKMQRQKQGSNSVTDAARDSFRKWAEEINREQLNKRGEAADRIENLRNVDRGDTSSAIEVEKIYYSKKDPYTKQDIKDPVQNMICKHIYDRESVLANIRECKKRRLLCYCPVSGCPNKSF
ncbi:hypothetical protein DINM_006476 [Dirofilaria immitis]|nr:hypothetical protein [Dirofilaria immitis]